MRVNRDRQALLRRAHTSVLAPRPIPAHGASLERHAPGLHRVSSWDAASSSAEKRAAALVLPDRRARVRGEGVREGGEARSGRAGVLCLLARLSHIFTR